jgi:dipeptidyl aminopeptidase/acylaminoacyl peptidase
MSEPRVLPYGSWPSPITAADVAAGGVRLGFAAVVHTADARDVWWIEGRPAEGGRQVLVSAARGDLLPQPWNARTRVHEYGGRGWLALDGDGPDRTAAAGRFAFTEWSDQRIYRMDGDATPRPLTPAPAQPAGWRYAEMVLSPDRTEIWCVREQVEGDGAVSRAIVAVPVDGSAADDEARVRVIVGGSQFFAFVTPSRDGRRLAWIAWDHPDMPWDATQLRVGDIVDGVVPAWRTVMGGAGESVLQPEWVPGSSERLYAISDRTNWWNLYEVDVASQTAAPRPLAPASEDFGGALWQLGYRFYRVLGDGRLAVLHGGDRPLGVLDPATGELADLDLPFSDWSPALDCDGDIVVGIAGSPRLPAAVVEVDVRSAEHTSFRTSVDVVPDAAYLPQPHAAAFTGPGGRDVYANVYPPRNPDAVAPDGELPPYIVFVHGGPTSSSPLKFDLAYAYFTSRGIGIIDVNYGGSTGHGREYRERLRGQWGVVDVEDCVAAARGLAATGAADGKRLAIRGGSAGGWTTLAALTRTDAFAAGASYFGVAELLRFAEDTHDFESRYLDGLIGPLPEARDLYVERAPLSHVDELSCPVLLLQGLEDKVVPPSQAELFRDALAAKGIPHAYLAFEGEQHGFRKAENIIASAEAELSFYGQVFGFTPPDVPVLKLS